jgi:putative membrane protein
MKTKILAPILAILAVVSTIQAEDAYPGDATFVKLAATSGVFEIKAGKLALQNAASPDVKIFGALMLADHAKFNDQLQLLAKNKGWILPETLGTAQQSIVDNFAELKLNDFDREYAAEMAKAHRLDKDQFRNAAKFAADADLRAWAAAVEPVIDQHLEHVPQLANTTVIIVK